MRKTRFFKLSLVLISAVFLGSGFAQDSTRWGLPERAKMRIGKAPITEIAYSPEGWRIAAATREDIWMYDARSGVTLKLLTGHTDSVLTVAFSPSGNTLASGGGGGRTERFGDGMSAAVHSSKPLRSMRGRFARSGSHPMDPRLQVRVTTN